MNKDLFIELASEQKQYFIGTCKYNQELEENLVNPSCFDNVVLKYQVDHPDIYSQLITLRNEVYAVLKDKLYQGDDKISYLINRLAVSSIQKLQNAVTDISHLDWFITRAMVTLTLAEKLNEIHPTESFNVIKNDSYNKAYKICGPELEKYLFMADTVADIFMETMSVTNNNEQRMSM